MEKNVELILDNWFNSYNQREWSKIEGLYADDVLFHAKAGPKRGGNAIVAVAKEWAAALPDSQITPLYAEEEDGVVVVHWRAKGTFEKPIQDITPTGNCVNFHGVTCFRLQEGKVTEHWATVDYRPLREKAA